MIQSIIDNDLYKFTMQQAVHMLYPRSKAEYVFINRGKTPFPGGFAGMMEKEVAKMADLRLLPREKEYLSKECYFLTPVYLDYLESYSFRPEEVDIRQENETLLLSVKGPWYRTILWESPLMAIISELFFKMSNADPVADKKRNITNKEKADILAQNNIIFADFGTRRRYSFSNHKSLINDLLSVEQNTLIGTSNVHLAKEFNIKPIGTMAHEWFMFHAALHGYQMANPSAIHAWVKAFHGDLGIALTDTYTTDAFLYTFDTKHAKLFDGVRQDSGDPVAFIDKIIAHYKKLHIDPKTKTIVFSDGLDISKAVQIHKHCRGKIRDAYGIGTSLTNDVGVTPLNIVIKMTKCRTSHDRPWFNTVKLSDETAKHTGSKKEIDHCMSVLNLHSP
ncbi:MAG: nicotinate phosphoribosyltransferase [Desulfobacula sp.]|jgi:nicotinate phosphoribosyltransferase|nr:nicotinate phosphoribosyltransferase [Desulfobacula sp.]